MYTLFGLIFIVILPCLSLESELGPYIRAYLVILIFLSEQGIRPQVVEIAVELMTVAISDVTIPEGAARIVY